MKKSTIITILLALVTMAGQAKTFKTIKNPVAMTCVNVLNGELKAREIIFRDTATTVHFTMEKEKGQSFRFASTSYLLDEDGNRYPLRSAEGISLDSWVQSLESGMADFTMHFRLLGIHDKKYKVNVPTLQELSEANPYTVPADWLKTDTITIRGRIEGYDAEKLGFTSMNCYYYSVFEKDGVTLIFDIAPDGTFEKKFQAYYPTYEVIAPDNSNIRFDNVPIYARPGETIDINISEMDKVADQTWLDILYIIQREATRQHFTTQEMQLALASMQGSFIDAMANYIHNHKRGLTKVKEVDGEFDVEILDSIEWKELDKMEHYKMMQRIDYGNPLLMCSDFHIVLNHIQIVGNIIRLKYKDVVVDEKGEYVFNIENEKKLLANYIPALRELMGTDKNNFAIQLCVYNEMMNHFDKWQSQKALLSNVMPVYLDVFTNPYIHQKAEAFYARKMEQKEIAVPLPSNNPSAVLIRALCARYPGRYLMIDFWGMSCGPCRAAIQMSKELRAEIAKRDDVKLIFIAEERTAEETICMAKANFVRLQELFQFNGIPHYETITPDGCRVRDDLRINGYDNFDEELERLKEKLK